MVHCIMDMVESLLETEEEEEMETDGEPAAAVDAGVTVQVSTGDGRCNMCGTVLIHEQ